MVDSKHGHEIVDQGRRPGRARALRRHGGHKGGRWLRRHVGQLHRKGESVCQRAQCHARRRVEAVRADPAGKGSSRRADRTSRQGGHRWAGAASHAGSRLCVCGHGHDLPELLKHDDAQSGQAGRQRRQAVLGLHPISGRMSWDTAVGRAGARPSVVSRLVDNSPRLDYLFRTSQRRELSNILG